MPKPRSDESESDFVSRCIPQVLDEGITQPDGEHRNIDNKKEAAAICYSMFRQGQKAGWVTTDEQPIFIGGPGQGSGSGGGGTSFGEAASEGREVSSENLGGGVCASELIQYEDDGSGVWKTEEGEQGFHDGNSEVAAYRLNRLMGGGEVPTTVYTEREMSVPQRFSQTGKMFFKGSSQRFVEGAKSPYDYGKGSITLKDLAKVSRDQIERTLALDIITYNADRHHGNWLLKGNQLFAIDHGHAQWNLWSTSNKAAGWKNGLFHAWHAAQAALTGAVDPLNQVTRYGGLRHHSFKFSKHNLTRWASITRDQFDRAMTGVGQHLNVNTDNAWANLQHIVENGEVEW